MAANYSKAQLRYIGFCKLSLEYMDKEIKRMYFKDLLEAADFTPRSYSGRGMY